MTTIHHDQTIEWMENDLGFHQPFLISATDDDNMEPRSIMEFNVTGVIVRSFLRDGGDYGHSLTLKLDDDMLAGVKAIVSTSPRFEATSSYYSPLKADNSHVYKQSGAF